MAGLNFYSQLQRAVQKAPAKMDGMPAAQWSQWLDSNASKLAVKKEEIEWSGVKEYLALRGKDRLFRDDLVGYLRDNGVRVQDVQLGGTKSMWAVYNREGEFEESFDESSEAEELSSRIGGNVRERQVERAMRGEPTKYEQYTDLGGENYREILITLPMRSASINTSGWTAQLRREVSPVTRMREYEVFDASGASQGISRRSANEDGAIAEVQKSQVRLAGHQLNYKSSHWDHYNILAHLRVDDRLDADGKRVLFINEIQSDWGQHGRKMGFGSAEVAGFRFDEVAGDWVRAEDALATHYGDASGEDDRLFDSLAEAKRRLKDGVQAAPFVTDTQSWVGLALKRAILMAVEGGYDRVALISGEQAAGLYSLEKQVSKISWITEADSPADGTGRLRIWNLDGSGIFDKTVEASNLEEHIGKVLSEKLIASPVAHKSGGGRDVREVGGHGLTVGGEGMKVFYDEIIPQVARDVLKKLCGEGLIRTTFTEDPNVSLKKWEPEGGEGDGSRAPTIDSHNIAFEVTLAMREKVLSGVPLFSLAEGSQVLDNPSSPDAMRMAIADLVGLDAEQLQDGVGRLVVTTSDQVADQVQAARKVAFDAWFAGSKVVDQEGKPLVVYHGTGADIASFADRPTFMTSDADTASGYARRAGSGGVVMPVYLQLRNPLHLDFLAPNTSSWYQNKRRVWMNKGYDGVVVGGSVFIAFHPEQIKSAIGNRGTYDPRDPDITHSLAAGELPERAQAFHDRQSGSTFFLADRIQSGKEAGVFLHETVHRHGKAHLPEGQFDALVGQVKAWAGDAQGSTERSIHDKAAGRVAAAGVSGPVADEELFAYAVEEAVAMGVQPSALAHEGSAEAWLSAVVQSIQRVADKLIGNSLEQLDGQDLVDLAYALAQVERPELGAVVAQALQDSLKGVVPSPENALGDDGFEPGC